jgi:hypothetical protein
MPVTKAEVTSGGGGGCHLTQASACPESRRGPPVMDSSNACSAPHTGTPAPVSTLPVQPPRHTHTSGEKVHSLYAAFVL